MQGKIGRAEFFSLALVLCLNSVVLLGGGGKNSWAAFLVGVGGCFAGGTALLAAFLLLVKALCRAKLWQLFGVCFWSGCWANGFVCVRFILAFFDGVVWRLCGCFLELSWGQ